MSLTSRRHISGLPDISPPVGVGLSDRHEALFFRSAVPVFRARILKGGKGVPPPSFVLLRRSRATRRACKTHSAAHRFGGLERKGVGYSLEAGDTGHALSPESARETVLALWRRPHALPALSLGVAPEGRLPQSAASALGAECPPLERPFPPSRLPCRGLRLGLGGSGGRGRQGGQFATERGRVEAQYRNRRRIAAHCAGP